MRSLLLNYFLFFYYSVIHFLEVPGHPVILAFCILA